MEQQFLTDPLATCHREQMNDFKHWFMTNQPFASSYVSASGTSAPQILRIIEGPPGSGKTVFAKLIAYYLEWKAAEANVPEVIHTYWLCIHHA
jgi:Cdc6-like AAA superfamily ATPase